MKLFAFLLTTVMAWGQVAYLQYDTVSFKKVFNSNAYTAGDVVRDTVATRNYLVFGATGKSVPERSGWVRSIFIQVDTANATNGTFSLKFFSDSTGNGYQVPADNAAWVPTRHSMRYYAGAAACTLAVAGTGLAVGETHDLKIPFVLTGKKSNLYAILTATGAYTAGQGTNIKVIVVTERWN